MPKKKDDSSDLPIMKVMIWSRKRKSDNGQQNESRKENQKKVAHSILTVVSVFKPSSEQVTNKQTKMSTFAGTSQ
jgi:hypothetical protein